MFSSHTVTRFTVMCRPFLLDDEDDETPPHFEMDGRSGDIRTTEFFSHNTRQHYTLRVTARDSGALPLEESAVIHVQVLSQCLKFQTHSCLILSKVQNTVYYNKLLA